MAFVVYPHSRVAPLIRIKYQGGTVCRTIIDNDELEILKILVENTLNRFSQKSLTVEDAHHDRDHQSCHGFRAACPCFTLSKRVAPGRVGEAARRTRR